MILPTLDTAASYFTDNYPRSRENWLAKVNSCQTQNRANQVGSFAHSLTGPVGETLASDWLWLGESNADNVGIIFSATHGIEGYVGNAVQCFLLDCLLADKKPLSTDRALLFVHALNPWGMAFLRRCDENGVDLNRNYVDFSHPPINTVYPSVQSCLTMDDPRQRQQALAELADTLGKTEYEIAVSGGQFVDPAGPYYGGKESAHGQQVCRNLIDTFSLRGRNLVVIDIHSGLGAYGHGELISDHPLDNANDRYAQKLFGNGVTNPARGDSSSVAKFGLQDYFWHQLMGESGCYLTLEFGTYPTEALFDVLMADHQVWRQPQDHQAMARQQQAMLRHFCPADPYWRQLILIQAAQVLDRWQRGLNS